MKRRKLLIILIPMILMGCGVWAYYRPLPNLRPISEIDNTPDTTSSPSPNIGWSGFGEQAVGAENYGVIATNNQEKALPIASIAKVMVALGVLNKYPLAINQTGPNVPITASDAAIYQQDLSSGQSVAAVQAGEQISEYQALEALLLPSANNFATTLTNWAFGSQTAYLSWANSYAKSLGMNNSNFADASGFSPATVSTPSDLVLLGETAMKNPVISQIVAESSSNLPVAGLVDNVDYDLGTGGINGIKTGNTDQAGGCFLFSGSYKSFNVVGVILGAPDLGTALHDAPGVLASFESNIQTAQVFSASQVVGYYSLPWGGKVNIIATADLSVVDLSGTQLAQHLTASDLSPKDYNQLNIGKASFSLNRVVYTDTVKLAKPIPEPSVWWRVFR